MARRSDFAQKLLDDLRVRKERMAASQSSKSSKPMAGDAYTYSKQAYKGSREMKTHQINGFKHGSTHHKSTGGNISVSNGETWKEIVPFGRGRNSEQIGDLSMALAFALENGGKLRRMDSSGNSSILGFLNQIARRPVEIGKMERSSIDRQNSKNGRFPTLSHLHIEEISRGAQRLNQILRACSNGLNIDGYSIDIGKELLKGAMDLEESLRMLVNLQEASEYMISPQSKTRITLLDDDEDENDNTVKTTENNQLARPIFSFDKPSRNSHFIQEAAIKDLKQRLMALTYPSETTRTLNTSDTTSRRRSASYNPNVKTFATFSEHKNHLNSSREPEKARIPNVIAKLMGLDELPENYDAKHISRKESSSKEKIEPTIIKKNSGGSSTRERKTKDSGTLGSPARKHKQIQHSQIQVTQDMMHGVQTERNLASFEGTTHDGKPPQKDVEEIKSIRSSSKANVKMDKHQNNVRYASQSNGSREHDDTKLREQKGKEKGEAKELILKHQLQQVIPKAQNGSEAATTPKGQAECDFTMLKTEKRDTQPSNNLLMSPRNLVFQQPQLPQKFESQDTEHYAGESEQQGVQQKIQGKRQTGSESKSLPKPIQESPNFPKKHSHKSQATFNNGSPKESIHTVQSVGFPNKKHHGDLVQDKSYPSFNVNVQDSMNKNSTPNSSPRNLNSEVIKEKKKTISPSVVEDKPGHLASVPKVKVTKVQKAEAPRRIDELAKRKNGNPQSLVRSQKHQTNMFQEVKRRRQNELTRTREEEQVRSSRFRKAEACSLKPNETVLGKQKSNLPEELQSQAEQASNLCSPPDGDCKSLKGTEMLSPNGKSSIEIDAQQGQETNFGMDKNETHSIVSDPLNLTGEGRTDISYSSHLENQKLSTLEKLEPLTESENRLKQILIKCQLFLNTAEALFKLNIPLNILHGGGFDCHDEESKLLLDCGYEVMKRKGKRQELSTHPFMRISITSLEVRSLDDLIKHLHKDFEKLKFYGRNGKAECVVEDYLPKMLEIDVYDRDPDVNCMWDFGWHDSMFTSIEKDDLARDVERHVLNALLDEVTIDLLLVSA
ncbi:hypothetical protein JCGZ_04421 [Jatropha curcas]|uniref:DUF3741 domain-containing protein n=1 Tax=Jatropha curcas TaxID=180498 RepID=A0A067KQJ8_JATCU|nr:uncharacterized protein LOC105633781 [Jatropha curcas]KDP38496.1 hypothetical protein JCGZ_04421 [Jatropha curcas]